MFYPVSSPAPDEMNVQVEHYLTRAPPHVYYELVTALCYSKLLCYFLCRQYHFRNDHAVVLFQVIDAFDMHHRNEEHMNRCRGSYIVKSNKVIVLIYELRRRFASDNFTENTIVSHIYPGTFSIYDVYPEYR